MPNKTSQTITFLFPHTVQGATGGYKVVYEYANRLVADGHTVNIVYSGSLFWRKKSLYLKTTNCIRYIQQLLKGYKCNWFNLDKRVKEHLTLSLNHRHIPKSDIYICTSPYTAMYAKDYPGDKNFYFIQGYENWGKITDKILRATYHYPLQKIVISEWLARIMQQEGCECTVIKNGFDFNYFEKSIEPQKRNKYTVAMIYGKMKLKGCEYGFEALNAVKKRYPELRVNIFGTVPRPQELPDWYTYHRNPDRDTHNRIYNESAIFMGCSTVEGWGLPIGEAMICGAAVVCTDNPGYMEMAIDEENALISPVKDAKGLAKNIIRLIEDDDLRYRLAKNGCEHIKRFKWDDSYKKLTQTLGLS